MYKQIQLMFTILLVNLNLAVKLNRGMVEMMENTGVRPMLTADDVKNMSDPSLQTIAKQNIHYPYS